MFAFWSTDPDEIINSCQYAVSEWYSEKKLYDYNNPDFSFETGHFTQLVWKNTERLGCASSKSKSTNNIYVVCNYDPWGNYRGQFEENVLPAD